ncbi:MAG TPA: PqqD family protein [Longimicrobiaceae bacterium]|nr:PqqD family protein [Longimicrobiaceae bacterium]
MFGWLTKKRGDAAPAPHDAPFRRAVKVVSAAEGDRTVLLEPVRGEYYGLDEVGTRIWELLPVYPTAAGLAERLHDEYDAPRERLAADVAALLGKLAALKLVERL